MASLHPACACSLGARNTDRCTGPLCEVPIIDHMKSSKQDATSDIIAYYM
ncbi:unnamed protein product [Staurois parvus]|uniref:Uncharacterized protein n=1 Tax=Staurois parvus TaxID=386267 RepID=A0ABN9ENF3_9NEOB|nr:unnamed protein product [Staurois parvus]